MALQTTQQEQVSDVRRLPVRFQERWGWLARTYSSSSRSSSRIGNGWDFRLNQRLIRLGIGGVLYADGDGSIFKAFPEGSSSLSAIQTSAKPLELGGLRYDEHGRLAGSADGSVRIRYRNVTKKPAVWIERLGIFEPAFGQIEEIAGPDEQLFFEHYGPDDTVDGKLVGREVVGKIKTITDRKKKQVRFLYYNPVSNERNPRDDVRLKRDFMKRLLATEKEKRAEMEAPKGRSWGRPGDLRAVIDSIEPFEEEKSIVLYRYDLFHNLIEMYEYSRRIKLVGDYNVQVTGEPSVRFTYNVYGEVLSRWPEQEIPADRVPTLKGGPSKETRTDALGNSTTTILDVNGRVIEKRQHHVTSDRRIQSAQDLTQRFRYDQTGRLATELDEHYTVTARHEYGHGWSKTVDGEGAVRLELSGRDGALQKTLEQHGSSPHWAVTEKESENDRIKVLSDANGNKTRYFYDSEGRRERTVYPDGSQELFEYDGQGRLSQEILRDGTRVRSLYSSYGTLMRKQIAKAADVEGVVSETFSSSAGGRVTKAVSDAGTAGAVTEVYRSDASGRRVSEKILNAGEIRTAYDEAGRRWKLFLPDGRTLRYTYDVLDRLQTVHVLGQFQGISIGYLGPNNIQKIDYPNGTQAQTTYDFRDRQKTRKVVENSTTPQSLEHGYDNADRRLYEKRLHATSSGKEGDRFEYDAMGNLSKTYRNANDVDTASPSAAAETKTYSFDDIRNRETEAIEGGATTDYTTNVLNQYTKVDATDFIYDKKG